ncbi:BTAD domain-containing putative transcriptional regulator [Williamsia deligens]|uniref:BTAD domain-containing putative transcriptional regulator n=1 Tax=Williamsia deligens TaxID=321325 RepID=A0ABW3G9F7_9NOCA|nr:BTAD domain-containing putative transcriptional regulator [Williamsia deligens]MCP2192955.1 DNA-binding transcriptional activator of the SARP family [Williamsia deligens]
MQYRLLGPLAVTRDGVPCDLGSPKQRTVLALLLLDPGRVVSTDRLCEALWGERRPANAMSSLHAYISNLRRILRDDASGTSPIVRQPPGYLIDVPADAVDVAEFRARAATTRAMVDDQRWADVLAESELASTLRQGPLLADLADAEWVAPHAAALADIDTEMREHRVAALLATEHLTPAIEESTVLREQNPLRDSSWWLSAVALYRAGRAPEALGVLREHARHLDAELGLEPGPELRAVEVSILNHDPELAAWPRRPGWTGAQKAPTPATTRAEVAPAPAASPTSLVGRRREVDVIDRLVVDTVAGTTRWLTLAGPPGIGKTRLAQHAGTVAGAHGGPVVWARNPEETAPAWWTLRQVVRGLDGVVEVPDGVDADTARFAIYESVQALVTAATASRPVTIVVDDVQWADPASLGCLTFLTGALVGVPVLVVLTIRDGDHTPAVSRLLAATARDTGNRHLAVPPLSPSEVAALADQVAEDSLTDRERSDLVDRTGGNPLFVSEYARLSHDERAGGDIPAAVRSVLDRRLASLPEEVVEVLRVAAVVGDAIDLRVLTAVCRLPAADIADLLDRAADHRIITAAGDTDGYVFAHGLLRQEVLATMRSSARGRTHARVADHLATLRPTGDVLGRRAHHLVAAGPLVDPLDVVAACSAAADDAAARWSSEVAAGWWRAAIDAYDHVEAHRQVASVRDDLTISLLQAESRAGRGQTVLDTARAQMVEAMDAGRVATTGRLAGALLRSSGGWPWQAPSADPGPLLDVLERARAFTADDPEAHTSVLAALAVGHCYNPDSTVPAECLTIAADLAAASDNDDMTAHALLGYLLTYSGVAPHSRDSLDRVDRLLSLGHAQSRVDTVIGHSVATMAAMGLGDVALAEHHLALGIAGSEELRLPVVRAQLRWMESTIALWHGDLAGARRQYQIAREVHEQTELYVAGSGMIALMTYAWERGSLAELGFAADDPLRWMQSVVDEGGDNGMVGVVVAGTAAVAGARGDRTVVETMLSRWWANRGAHVWTTLGTATLLAHVAVDLQLADHHDRFIADLAPWSDRVAIVGQVGCVGPVAMALARLYAATGRVDEARAHALEALRLGERTDGLPTVLRARLCLAQLDPPSARRDAELADIHDRARALDMLGVAEAVGTG